MTHRTMSRGIKWPVAGQQLDHCLARAVDAGLLRLLVVAPLILGGRHPVGRLVFVTLVFSTAACHLARICCRGRAVWRWSGAEWLLAAGTLLVLTQLVPLPASWLSVIAPSVRELLPLWDPSSGMGLGSWQQVSLHPEATRNALAVWLALATLFLVVVQHVATRDDAERILRWVTGAVVFMAAVGLAQFLVGNDKFMWVYRHPHRVATTHAKGPFFNPNHFALFLAHGLGAVIWWIRGATARSGERHDRDQAGGWGSARPGGRAIAAIARSWQNPTVAFAGLAVVLVAGALSFSRGGVLVMLGASLVAVGLLAAYRLLPGRALALTAASGLVLLAALGIYGYRPLTEQLATLGTGSIEELEAQSRRGPIWQANARAIPQFMRSGAGAGSHPDVYPAYLSGYVDVEYTHAESGYLQVLLELGLPGLLLLACGALLALFWCARSILQSDDDRVRAAAVAVLAGLLVSLVHSIADFGWYLPACATLTAFLLAVACRLDGLRRSEDAARETVMRRPVAVLILVAVIATGLGLFRDRLPSARAAADWDRYRTLALQDQPATWESNEDTESTYARMIYHLEQVVRKNPRHARAHVRLAGLYLREFDQRQQSAMNAISLAQLRDAAAASEFPDPEALWEWLRLAIGDNLIWLERAREHTDTGLRLCPLQGEAYVYRAELLFLQTRRSDAVARHIAQALRLRPHHGAVLLAAGGEAAMQGDAELAMKHWKQVFQNDPQFQAQIIRTLAPQIPAPSFVQIFQPNAEGLRQLLAYYQNAGLETQAVLLAPTFARAMEQRAQDLHGEAAAQSWYEAQRGWLIAKDGTRALTCARQAVEVAPYHFESRFVLAQRLLEQKEYHEAMEQLRWCLRREPSDERLRQAMVIARRELAGG